MLPSLRTRFSRFATVAVLAAASLPLAAAPAQADLAATLDAAPQGAQVVLVAPDLARLDAASARLNEELQLNNPMMASLTASMQAMGGMQQGLDQDGSMMVVLPTVMALAMGGQGGPPPFLLFMPVDDYAAFVGNFGGQDNGGVTELAMPGDAPGFARKVGSHAVLSPMQNLVRNYQPANNAQAILDKVGEPGQKNMSESAVSLFVDIESVAPAVKPMLQVGLNAARMQMQQLPAEANPQQALQAMEIGFNTLNALLEGMQGLALSMHVPESGMQLSFATQMVDGSAMAKALPGGKGTAIQLLGDVPDASFLMAASYDLNAIDAEYLVQSILEVLPEGEEFAAIRGQYEAALPLARNSTGGSFAWFSPSIPDNGGAANFDPSSLYRVATVLRTEDPAGARQSIAEYLDAMKGMKMPMGMNAEGEPMEVSYEVDHQAKAVQIAGRQVDTYSVKTIYPEDMQNMGPMAGMLDTFGTYDGYVGEAGGGVVMTTTHDAALLESSFEAMAGKAGLGGKQSLAAAADQLPANPAIVTFVSVDGLVTLLTAMGMPIQPGEELDPIAMGFGVQNNAGEYTMHVPFSSAKFIGNAGQQVMMMMMMGGMPDQR
ncbi:MAG: hypothetical protein ACOC3G_03255 [Phycisphaeraceae bacterium]